MRWSEETCGLAVTYTLPVTSVWTSLVKYFFNDLILSVEKCANGNFIDITNDGRDTALNNSITTPMFHFPIIAQPQMFHPYSITLIHQQSLIFF